MSMCKEPDVDPKVAHLVARVLYQENNELSEEEITARIAPENIAIDESRRGADFVRKSLKQMPDMGILEKESNQYKTTKQFQNYFKSLDELTPKAFSKYILDVSLADESDQSSNCYELAHALAVLLNFAKPFDIKYDSVEELIKPYVVNRDQWRGFARWACFLGFARPVVSQDSLMLDAEEIYRPFVMEVLGKKTSMTKMDDFLTALGKKFPISDRGSVGSKIVKDLADKKTEIRNGKVSEGLSLALLLLEHKKMIEFTKPLSDDKRAIFHLTISDANSECELVGLKAR